MIKMGVTPEVNAISTLMLAFSIILVTGYWVFRKIVNLLIKIYLQLSISVLIH